MFPHRRGCPRANRYWPKFLAELLEYKTLDVFEVRIHILHISLGSPLSFALLGPRIQHSDGMDAGSSNASYALRMATARLSVGLDQSHAAQEGALDYIIWCKCVSARNATEGQ